MATIFAQGFTGFHQDPITSGYLLGNGYRCYLPSLMRFNAADGFSPFGWGGIHPYVYCANDPINYSDPTGHVTFPVQAVEEDEAVVRDVVNGLVDRVTAQADAPDTVTQTESRSGVAMDRVGVQGPSTSRVEEGSPPAKRMRSEPGTSAADALGMPTSHPLAVLIESPPTYDEAIAALNRNVGIQPFPGMRDVPALWEGEGITRVRALNSQLDQLDAFIGNLGGRRLPNMFLDARSRISEANRQLSAIITGFNDLKPLAARVLAQGREWSDSYQLRDALPALKDRLINVRDDLNDHADVLGLTMGDANQAPS